MNKPEYWAIGQSGSRSAARSHQRDMYRIIRDEMSLAARTVDDELADAWERSNDTYSLTAQLSQAAKEAEVRTAQNRAVSLTDFMGGIGAAGITAQAWDENTSVAANIGRVGVGLTVGILGNRFVRGREHGYLAKYKSGVATWLRNTPERLGKFARFYSNASTPAAVASTHFVLSQRDPEYRRLIERLEEEDQQEQEQ